MNVQQFCFEKKINAKKNMETKILENSQYFFQYVNFNELLIILFEFFFSKIKKYRKSTKKKKKKRKINQNFGKTNIFREEKIKKIIKTYLYLI